MFVASETAASIKESSARLNTLGDRIAEMVLLRIRWYSLVLFLILIAQFLTIITRTLSENSEHSEMAANLEFQHDQGASREIQLPS